MPVGAYGWWHVIVNLLCKIGLLPIDIYVYNVLPIFKHIGKPIVNTWIM